MSTFNFNKANLAAAQIPASITSSQTSITVDSGDAATFPTPPFFATIMPAGGVPNTLNSEIVQVTAVNTSTGVLTITRAQRGSTAKQQDEGAVIMNGVYIEDLAQSQAVGKSFFSATLSSSVYYIQDARLTTTPENGDSIRVVFGSNWTSGTPKLSLNSGTSYNIYAGNNLTASHGTTTTPAMVKSGVIYELTYYNGAWYILNLVGNSSITSDNVDWATLGATIFPVGTVLTFYDTSDHSDFLGLTWARFAAGRMVVGYNSSDSDFATIGNTGGEKTHTLTVAEMPAHRHTISNNGTSVAPGAGAGGFSIEDTYSNSASHNMPKANSPTGGGGAHNNMPPYITAALWRRTA